MNFKKMWRHAKLSTNRKPRSLSRNPLRLFLIFAPSLSFSHHTSTPLVPHLYCCGLCVLPRVCDHVCVRASCLPSCSTHTHTRRTHTHALALVCPAFSPPSICASWATAFPAQLTMPALPSLASHCGHTSKRGTTRTHTAHHMASGHRFRHTHPPTIPVTHPPLSFPHLKTQTTPKPHSQPWPRRPPRSPPRPLRRPARAPRRRPAWRATAPTSTRC